MTTFLLACAEVYTTAMSFFVRATQARVPKTDNAGKVALLLAAILIILAVVQLFSFSKFSAVIDDMWLPGVNGAMPKVLAAFIVTAEVFAVPFLLRMRLSPLMRLASMVLGWLVVAWWLYVLTWQNVTATALANNGLFGATLGLPVGWWSVCFMLGVAVLAGWASWGLWPFPLRKR